jgi:hypothetical protein
VLSTSCAPLDSEIALPLPCLDLKSYLTEIGQAHHAESVARGIEAAQVVARMLRLRAAQGFDPELLTVAALCQDCGLLLGRTQIASKADPLAQKLRALHPSIGAGLVAALVEYSTELPALVAQHHRRLNEPRITPDSYARIQNRGSRLLAVIVRWLDLVDVSRATTSEKLSPAARLAFAEPAAHLMRETLRGDWDRPLAGDLLMALGFRVEAETLHEARRVASSFESREAPRLRLDSADEEWPHLNLELAKASREIQHVRFSAR